MCFFSPGLYAQFEFNNNCQKAFKHIFWLKYSMAEDIIRSEKIKDPNNKIPIYLEDYLDCIKILTGQKESDFLKYKDKFSDRINSIKRGQKDSPYYHYCLAEMYFHSALVKLNLGSNISASFDIASSFNHIKKNLKKFPDSEENRKIHGILQLFLGSVPDSYKWLTKLSCLSGNIQTGLKELEQYCLRTESIESRLIMCFSLIDYSGSSENGYNYLKNVKNLEINNPLIRYSYAYSAIKSGNNDEAIELLENYKPGEDESMLVFYDYLLGKAYLYNLDERTITSFNSFLKKYNGMNYIPTIYQKLSWFYFLNENMLSFNESRRFALTKGKVLIESDKQARNELLHKSSYDSVLLKARVLFDGGYYEKASQVMLKHKYYIDHKDNNIRGEYFYRLARINHKQNKIIDAKRNYLKVLNMEDKPENYIVPNSALQLGLIYEKEGLFAHSEEYLKKCLSLNKYQYSFGIGQKARSALSRIR